MSDGQQGCSCEEPELVIIKDQNMSPKYVPGNPYSRYCRSCGRRYFCKDMYWRDADEKYIIPKGEDEPIPADEYAERDDTDNFFECPACDEPTFGEPDECESCDQEYIWEN